MTDGPKDAYDDEDMILAAEHVLGLLGAAEERAFVERLQSDPALRARVADWAEDFTRLTDEIEEVAPPPHLKAEIERRLFPAPHGPGLAGRLAQALGAVAVLAAAALAVVLFLDPFAPAAPTLTAEIAAEDGGLVIRAGWHPEDGVLRLDRQAGSARAGRALELWLIAGEAAPVSLGVLPETETAELRVAPEIAAQLEGGILAVSDEPVGGSPTGQPTGDVLGLGPVTAL